MDIILQASGLKKYYGDGEAQVRALDGIDLTVERGEFIAIVGASGCGKSTLLHLLGGIDRPTAGSVQINGTSLYDLNDEQITLFRRRRIGFIFQNYNLIPSLTVWDNIILPMALDGQMADQKFIKEVVAVLGIQKKLKMMPNNLSGGEQQRVAIARAISTKPAIILADELTGNLDHKTSDNVVGLLKVTSHEFHQTILMITHDSDLAKMADRMIHMEDGKLLPDLRPCKVTKLKR